MDRYLLLVLILFTGIACDKPRPALPPRRIDTATPEGKFEWAMQRLERAVLDFTSGQRSGLHIGNREIAHELFPPTADSKRYTARVVITSEQSYVPSEPLGSIDEEEILEKRRREIKRFNERAGIEDPEDTEFDPIARRFQSQMDDLTARHSGPTRRFNNLDTPELKVEQVYELVFRENRWQLETEVETEHERLWFDYALEGPSPERPATNTTPESALE